MNKSRSMMMGDISKQSMRATLALLLAVALMVVANNARAVSVGDDAPEIELPSLDGSTTIRLSDLKGRVVLVDFWASWCPPCRISLPMFNELRAELQQYGFEILAVNVDETVAEAYGFLDKYPVDYIVAYDQEGNTVPAKYDVKGMPTSYLVDQKGKIRMVHEGFKASEYDKIKGEIFKLFGE